MASAQVELLAILLQLLSICILCVIEPCWEVHGWFFRAKKIVQGNSRKSAWRFGHGSDVGCRNILQRSTNILKSFSTGLRPQYTQHLKTFQRSSIFRPGYGHITFGSSGKALLPQDSRATVQLEEAPHPVAMATGCSAVHDQIHSL